MPHRTALLVACALVLAACTAAPNRIHEGRTARFQVRLQLDAETTSAQAAQIEIRNRSGDPVDAATVLLAPMMTDMGHTQTVLTAARAAPGRYAVAGTLFTMRGDWQVVVVVRADGAPESVQFPVVVR